MARHLQVIEISIKAHIVVDRDMNKQLEALTALKAAHESGDYSKVIAMATVDAVKAQQKSRRFEDAPAIEPSDDNHGAATTDGDALEMHDPSKGESGYLDHNHDSSGEGPEDGDDEGVPAFLKRGKERETVKAE